MFLKVNDVSIIRYICYQLMIIKKTVKNCKTVKKKKKI